jgi:hypothetical protein
MVIKIIKQAVQCGKKIHLKTMILLNEAKILFLFSISRQNIKTIKKFHLFLNSLFINY